jgi:hypothetical protein
MSRAAGPSRPYPAYRALGALALLLALAVPPSASATIIGDPTLTVGAGLTAGAAEIDLGLSDIETNRLFFRGDYGVAPNVDAFGRVGIFEGDFGLAEVDGFGLGGGVRLDLQQEREWHFGGLGQLMYFKGESTVTIPGIPGFFPATTFEADFDWFELDFAGAASYRALGQVVPYFGAKLGLVTGDPDTDLGFTIFGGGTFNVNPRLSLGAELRLIDDDALGLFARYRF